MLDWRDAMDMHWKNNLEFRANFSSNNERPTSNADLYAYITLHHWKQGRKRRYCVGINKLIEQNMEGFRKKMSE